ncbi:MAG: PTS sugar transporter subunit IIA [Pseudomonadota bacterium]
MEFSELIGQDNVVAGLKVASCKQLFQDISNRARDLYDLDPRAVCEGLMEREKLGSTAMGNGIAIPHARLAGVNKIVGFFAKLDKPIDFEAADGLGVDLVFVLLVPEDSGTQHLRALAKVSRLLRDQEICLKLRAGGDKTALYALLTDQNDAKAA